MVYAQAQISPPGGGNIPRNLMSKINPINLIIIRIETYPLALIENLIFVYVSQGTGLGYDSYDMSR